MHVDEEDCEMSTPAQRIEVFQDTMDWIKSDSVLSTSIPVAKKNTTVFYEDDYPAFESSKTKDTIISVSGDRSYQAAMRLRKENPGAKIAVMNFANAFHAGGGVTKGSSAQEECLCRTSTLYPLLYRRTLRDSFYKHHNDLNTPKVFQQIEFAVYCPPGGSKNFDVFNKVFGNMSAQANLSGNISQGNTKMSKIELINASCADQTVDVVVNAANDGLWAGGGICGVIFKKAGSELAEACKKYKTPLNDGDAVITPAFNMKNAKAIIHAVGPNFGATPRAFEELFKAYYNSLLVLKIGRAHV